MTTFRTYLKIFLSHRIYIAIYLSCFRSWA